MARFLAFGSRANGRRYRHFTHSTIWRDYFILPGWEFERICQI